MDIQLYKETLRQWASGVCILTTMVDGKPHGLTVSSFSSLSINPLLIMACIGKTLASHNLLLTSGVFAINILSTDQLEWGKLFAGMIPETGDRFAGIDYITAESGAPILPGVLGWLDCRLYNTYDGGDHTIIAGEVLAAQATGDGKAPLAYYNRAWGTFVPLIPAGSVKHVVLFRLKENTPENVKTFQTALNGLRNTVPQIRELEIGANIVPSERAYDLALVTRFDSVEDMKAYQSHPDHVKVLEEVIRPLSASIIAADYEI
jgi:flavin reductase (DIM6/NTAB) family NADH-FMN oxidoreductase RutF